MLKHEDINMGGGGTAARIFSFGISWKWVISLKPPVVYSPPNPDQSQIARISETFFLLRTSKQPIAREDLTQLRGI